MDQANNKKNPFFFFFVCLFWRGWRRDYIFTRFISVELEKEWLDAKEPCIYLEYIRYLSPSKTTVESMRLLP